MSGLDSSSEEETSGWPPATPQTPVSYYVEVASSDTTSGGESDDDGECTVENKSSDSLGISVRGNSSDPGLKIDADGRSDDETPKVEEHDEVSNGQENRSTQNSPAAVEVDTTGASSEGSGIGLFDKGRREEDVGSPIFDEMLNLEHELDEETEHDVGLQFDDGVFTGTDLSGQAEELAAKGMDVEFHLGRRHTEDDVNKEDIHGKDFELMLLKREMEAAAFNKQREDEMLAEERQRRLEIRKRQIELERQRRLSKLEDLARVAEMMTVQFDAKIEQVQSTIDEINAELMVEESVELARELRRGQTMSRDRLLDGYQFSPREADSIVRKMARRSEMASSSYVSSASYFSGITDDEPGYFARPSKSTYPAMIKRLVNAYAGRPNINGRSTTESHRLLRQKLKQVLDGNL
jgi:hypothetical protein